ncbi:MAG: heparinase II/III family protein [Armatimonadota bacterium]
MLAERYGKKLGRLLVPASGYHPFPTAAERERWRALPAALRAAALRRGKALLGHQWPQLPATLYLDFARSGDRQRYERPYFARRQALGSLVLAECIEGKGRFLDDIANGSWAICEESSWCIPAHNSGGALPDSADPIIDLFAAETGSLLAWSWYLLRDRLAELSPRLLDRIAREVKARILDPFLTRDDFWWMGQGAARRLNNWSPWCTSTCLAAFAVLELDSQRRRRAVAKSLDILDRFLEGYHADGGCDEGPSYWTVAGGALFDCLEMLYSMTHGRLDVYDEPLIREIGRYIYRAHISGDYFVNFADCPGKVHPPAGMVYRYGQRIGDEAMVSFGSYWYRRQGREALLGGSLLRLLPNLFYAEGIGRRGRAPMLRDTWLDGTQVMAARQQAGSDRGLYLAAKGGHNAEVHNHNDVGQFIIYSDGEPVLIDPGVGVYTRETFSDRRYEIWTMQSAYHNLPTVNGVQQEAGERYRARRVRYRSDDAAAELALDLRAAYPKESGIASWRRRARLDREAGMVEIEDDFALARSTRDVELSLMTPCRPRAAGGSAVALKTESHSVRLEFDEALEVEVQPIRLDDARLRGVWGSRLYRLLLRPRRPVRQAVWRLRVSRV